MADVSLSRVYMGRVGAAASRYSDKATRARKVQEKCDWCADEVKGVDLVASTRSSPISLDGCQTLKRLRNLP